MLCSRLQDNLPQHPITQEMPGMACSTGNWAGLRYVGLDPQCRNGESQDISDVREMVFVWCSSPAAGRPRGHGGGTPDVHPGSACRGAPATCPRAPASARRDQPCSRDGVMGARHRRVVTNPVLSPVRPATLWMHVVSMASARVMAGRMVVSRRASIDVPSTRGVVTRSW
jgi:hypothetical protein